MGVAVALTARQKAAIIVRVLLEDEHDLSLQVLPAREQAMLVRELAGMGMVDRQTRDRVVAEFCDTLEEVGVTFPDGLSDALALLGGRISEDCADRLQRLAALSDDADPWDRLAALPTEQLADLAMGESVGVSAVLFSRLPTTRAAEVFGKLPAARARQIAHAMSLSAGIEAGPLRRIGLALLQAVDALPRPALTGAPSEKVGEILNQTSAAMREDVLDGLEQEDSEFAGEVRRKIFTWANIPSRIEARDIPRILRVVDQPSLMRALAGATGADAAVSEFILSSVSERMATGFRDEMEAIGKVSAAEVETAMAAVTGTIREMMDTGELTLIAPTDEDVTLTPDPAVDAADQAGGE